MKKKVFCFILCAMLLLENVLKILPTKITVSADIYTDYDVSNANELEEALKNGGDIVLWQDITTSELVVEDDSSIDLNGYKLVVEGISISNGKIFTIMDGQYTDGDTGNGKLITTGKTGCAGIQTNEATLIIESGVVEAVGGKYAAGIGGSQGDRNNAGKVIINDGVVTANGGIQAAGIGGGAGGYSTVGDLRTEGGTGGVVIINGGTIIARGGIDAAGIGGGAGGYSTVADLQTEGGAGGVVTINDGMVTAEGGRCGAGIGGGASGTNLSTSMPKGGVGGIVTINGGTVTAKGGSSGVGIGAGGTYDSHESAGSITINGGMVKVVAGDYKYCSIGAAKPDEIIEGDLSVKGGTLEFLGDCPPTNVTNVSFKNCTVIGENQYVGTYNEEGKFLVKVNRLYYVKMSTELIYMYADVTISRPTTNIEEFPTGNVVFKLDGMQVGACKIEKYNIVGDYIQATVNISVMAKNGKYTFAAEYEPGIDDKYANEETLLSIDYEFNKNSSIDVSNCHKVIFSNGSSVRVQLVNNGQAAIAPELIRTGYKLSWDKTYDYITEDLVVNAIWIPNKYKVIFKNGEEVLDTQEVEYEKSAVAPTNVIKEGYTFAGWDQDFSSITGDLVVNAKWLINTYTISTISGNGGTVTGGGIIDYNTMVELIAKPDAGYEFDGWYEDDVKLSDEKKYSFTVTTSRNLEARFTLIKLNSISIDGAQELENMFIVECDKTLDLYVFPNPGGAILDETKVQWSTSDSTIAKVENGIVTGIAPGVVTISACIEGLETSCIVTVIPMVEEKKCSNCSGAGKITCYNCNGTGKKTCDTCRGNGKITTKLSCTKCNGAGKTSTYEMCGFCLGNGYYMSSSLGVNVMCQACNATGKFLYTKECATCVGKGSISSVKTCTNCEGKGKEECSEYNKCYRCAGGGKIKCTLYTIKYDANGGSNSPYTQVKIENRKLQISDNKPKREGYIFCGWTLESSSNLVEYLPGDYITEDKSIELYAVWKEEKTLISISIAQMPFKVNYVEGENFDFSGLIVTANYSDNTTRNVTDYGIAGYESTPGEKTIRITYENKTVDFKVIVKSKIPQVITSNSYKVSETVISKVAIGTTVKELLGLINDNQYVKVFNNQTEVKADETVGTGMTVKIMDGNMVIKSYIIIVTGDVNGDGNATVTDMLAIKAHILGKNKLSNEYATAADTSGDNVISITDFIQIKAKILGKGNITAR